MSNMGNLYLELVDLIFYKELSDEEIKEHFKDLPENVQGLIMQEVEFLRANPNIDKLHEEGA